MKAHDWVSKVEEAATTEAVSSETEEQWGGAAPPGEDEKEKREDEKEKREDGKQQEDVVTRGEDEKEGDPNSVQVRSQQCHASLNCCLQQSGETPPHRVSLPPSLSTCRQ